MKRFILFLLLSCLPQAAFAATADLTAEFLAKKSQEARQILEAKKVGSETRKGKMVSREILLAAYSPSRDKIELVRLKVEVSASKKKFVFSVATPGYKVERLRGQGITHLAFGINDRGGEEMILLDSLHFMKDEKRGEFYFPYTDIFLRRESVSSGLEYFLSRVREAQARLCELGVRSRSFPDKKLCEIFPDELLAALALIEQSDDDEFNGKCPRSEEVGLASRIYGNCAEYSVYKVLTHIVRNEEKSFSYIASRAGARGIMQFMGSKKVPTYQTVLANYPEARLIKDFPKGATDMKNSIVAAICLLDFYMANLPEGARGEYAKNQRLGGIFPVAAYNGGPKRSARLYEALSGRELTIKNLKIPKRTLKKETAGYIFKYLNVWSVLDDLVSRFGPSESEKGIIIPNK